MLAVLGLIVAPVARAAMAMNAAMQSMDQTMDHAMALEMVSGDMVSAAMPDMTCCPDAMASKSDTSHSDSSKPDPAKSDPATSDCGKDCPLMAACMAQSMAGFSDAPAIGFVLSMAQIIVPENDPDIGSLTRAPSPRPPNA